MRFKGMMLASIALLASAAVAQEFDLFGFADADHDGKVTQTEYATFREGGWSYLMNGQESVKAAEANDMMKGALAGSPVDAQGNITHAAYTAATPELFKKADKNGNGSLNAEELQAIMTPAG